MSSRDRPASKHSTDSQKEAQADPDLIVIFVDMDADHDGQISPTEFIVVPITQEDGSTVR
jgi:hypothetical protein